MFRISATHPNKVHNNGKRKPTQYGEYRCKGCDTLLFKGVLVGSEIEVVCKTCGKMNAFAGISEDALLCVIPNCPSRAKMEAKGLV